MEISRGSRNDLTAMHQALVDQLKRKGVLFSPSIEAAFRAVPRYLFLPDVAPEEVYRNQAIVTKRADGTATSSSSEPGIMAVMLEQLHQSLST